MVCRNCNKQLKENMAYCPECGTPTKKDTKIKYPPLFNYIFTLLMIIILLVTYYINYKEFSDMPYINIIIMFVYFLALLSAIQISLSIRLHIKSKNREIFDELIKNGRQYTKGNKNYIIIKDKGIKIIEIIAKIIAISFMSFFIYVAVQDNGGLNKVISNIINEFNQIISTGSVIGRWDFECQSTSDAKCVAIESYLTFNEDNTLTCTEVYTNGTGSCGTGTWSQQDSNVIINWDKTPITPAYSSTLIFNGNTMTSGNQTLYRH